MAAGLAARDAAAVHAEVEPLGSVGNRTYLGIIPISSTHSPRMRHACIHLAKLLSAVVA
jgi:hypothetical protein